jgi:catechol 1,2-dioxygenase
MSGEHASAGPSAITEAVLASFAGCEDARLRELLEALVRHLHAFAREARLTHPEWEAAMRLLAETGEITSGERQEFVLWSDALGLSMLVDALAHPRRDGATESTVVGPFWAAGSPLRPYGASIAERGGGMPAWVHGRVLDTGGAALAGAEIDVWQNGDNRLYAVQDETAPEHHLRGRFLAREDGSYAFLGVRPTPYPIPDDGPVGAMLAATGRHPWRPAHIHLRVTSAGCEPLVTHVFDAESPYLDSDAVFAVKPSLLRRFAPRAAADPERPPGVDGAWCSVENDLVLQRAAGA